MNQSCFFASVADGTHTNADSARSSLAFTATAMASFPAASHAARSAKVALNAAGMRVVLSPAVIEKLLITMIRIHCVIRYLRLVECRHFLPGGSTYLSRKDGHA